MLLRTKGLVKLMPMSLWNCITAARNCSVAPSAVNFDNYDETKSTFRLISPEYFNFASDVIDHWAINEVR